MKKLSWLPRAYFLIAFLAVFLIHTGLSYWGLLHYHYLVAPGNDIAPHLYYIQIIKQGNFIWGSYPPGFHYLIMFLAKLTDKSELQVITYLEPALLVISGLAIFYLARVAFGPKTALFAYFLYTLVSLQPLQTASDGGLPNILIGDTVVPIILVCWIRFWQGRYWWSIPLIILVVITVLTHHMSFLVLLGVLSLSAAGLLALKTWRAKGLSRLVILAEGLAIAALVGWAFYYLPFFSAARSLLETALFSPTKSRVLSWVDYSALINGLIFQMGAVGLFLLIYFSRGFWKKSTQPDLVSAVVIGSYYLFYFIGSRLPTIEPERLARDLALPATILTAYAIVQILHLTEKKVVIRTAFVVVIAVVVILGVWRKTKIETSYDRQVRFSAADVEAIAQIRRLDHPPTDVVTKGVFGEQELFWKIFAANEIEDKKINLISEKQAAIYSGTACILVGYSHPGIWPDELTDSSLTDKYLANPEYVVRSRIEDNLKVWYLFCKQ